MSESMRDGAGTPDRREGDGAGPSARSDGGGGPARGDGGARKAVPLRIDPAVYAALAKWAADDLRSVNAQIEHLLRRALDEAGRSPRGAGPIRKQGRPRRGATPD